MSIQAATFDPAGRLDLYYRKNRDGSKKFVFTDSYGNAYDISGIDFKLNVKYKATDTTNVIQLTTSSGLTVGGFGNNELTITLTESQTNIKAVVYYWELFNDTSNKTWLCGNLNLFTGIGDDIAESDTVTVSLTSNVTITISESSGSTTWGNIGGNIVNQTDLSNALENRQPKDTDLSEIAALSPSNDDIIQRKSGSWTNRTPSQLKSDLALTKSDVGLSNVDNTSDSNKPVSTAQAAADSGILDAAQSYADSNFLRLNSIITPTALSVNTADYNPTGLSSATFLRLSASTTVSITGLQSGVGGRIVHLHNVGSNTISLANEDATSSAANRFAISATIFIAANQGIALQYDGTSQRWRALGNTYFTSGFWNTSGSNTGGSGAFSFGSGEASRIIFRTNSTARGRLSALFAGWHFGADTEPVSTVEVGGSFGTRIQTFSANTTLDATNATVLVDATSGNITITLPAASGATRRLHKIVKIDSSVNTVTISTTAEGDKVISAQWTGYEVQSNGTNWYKVGVIRDI